MKRAFAILLVLTMAISMVSCGSANSSNESLQNQTVPGDGSTAVADNNAQTEDSTDSQNEDDSQAQGMDGPDVP